MAYNCIIAKLENVRAFPGADRILLANCCGAQVVVGMGAKDGDVVGLFLDDGQLSKEYLKANNLVGYTDSEGKRQGGFFSESGRVKAQKFRGQKSEAYVCSLESFKFTGYDISKLRLGDQFNELNGVHICNKYFTPATLHSQKENANKEKSSKKINEYLRSIFQEHYDTAQFRFARNEDLQGYCILTGKYHGTSARQGHLYWPTEHEIKNPFKKLWNTFCDEILHGKRHLLNFWCNDTKASEMKFKSKIVYDWTHVYGTRRVIKGQVNFDPSADYRNRCAAKIAPFVKKGETWFYEIVGWEDTGAPIMQTVSTKEMGKEFVKRFGDTMTYKYGCLPGTCDIYVYRITVQNADGNIYELPWNVVKAKCVNAGIKHVPEIGAMLIKTDQDVAKLKELVEYYTEEVDIADPIDSSHIREGICIRIEKNDGSMKIWKNKTFAFKVLEGIAKNDELYQDEEEIQSSEEL